MLRPALAAAVMLAGLAVADRAAGAPGRVVSINLCADQLAMLLAAPGQLVAVSHVARDPMVSAMAREARTFPVTRGGAEEVFALRPDLVLAGTFTTPATVGLLERLGVPVIRIGAVRDFEDLRAGIRDVGAALGRTGMAEEMIARFDADLARLARPGPAAGPRAALVAANRYVSGQDGLAGRILAAAGLANVAAELGLRGSGPVPLEVLVMADPDIIVTSTPYPGASRAEAVLDHPALRALAPGTGRAELGDADWICGTPHVLRAVSALAVLREGPAP